MRLGSRDPYFLYHAGIVALRAGRLGQGAAFPDQLTPGARTSTRSTAAGAAGAGVDQVRAGRRQLCAAALLLAGLFAFGDASRLSSAHPLGNFTVNHLSQVRISQGSVQVHYVLDQAEIPTFQEIQRYDRDGDGTISGPEQGPCSAKARRDRTGLRLSADGRRSPSVPALVEPGLSAGQGGLSLTAVEADFCAAIPAAARTSSFRDDTYVDRVGWKAIQILPGTGHRRPLERARERPDQRSARLSRSTCCRAHPITAGELSRWQRDPAGQRARRREVGPVTTDRAQDGFAGALTSGNDHGVLILLLLGSAFVWGALHALSPGHGKTMVAGYLAGAVAGPRTRRCSD
jgi:hypothetical protein